MKILNSDYFRDELSVMNPSTTWNEFSIRIPVKASLPELFSAWTTQAGIEKWFLRSAIYKTQQGSLRGLEEQVQQGDHYRWLWHGYPDESMESNAILASNGTDFFQFEFSGKCIVTVKLEPANGYTMVTLKQERIPEDSNPATNLFVGCQLGWTFYLTNLKLKAVLIYGTAMLILKTLSIPDHETFSGWRSTISFNFWRTPCQFFSACSLAFSSGRFELVNVTTVCPLFSSSSYVTLK
jgi:uncharacterized protein YndB with AHSA1/START domain